MTDEVHSTKTAPPAVADDPAPAARRRRRRWPIVLVVLLLAFVALVGRLLSGPIFTGLFTDTLSARIQAALGQGAAVSIGVVGLSLDPDFRPRLHLRDVLVSRPAIGSVSIDTLTVARSWIGNGEWAENATAEHVLLDLPYGRNPLKAVAAFIRGFDEAVADPPLRSLDIASLTVRRLVASGARVLALDRVGVSGTITPEEAASLIFTGADADGPWIMRFNGTARTDTGSRVLNVETEGLTVEDIAGIGGETDPLMTGPAAFSGTLTLVGDVVSEARGELALGPLITADGEAAPIAGARTRLEVRMPAGANFVELVPSPVILPAGSALVTGRVNLPRAGDSAFTFDVSLGARGGTAADPSQAIGSAAGSYDPDTGVLVVDRLQAATEGATFNAAVRITHDEDHLSGALSGVFPQMSVPALKALWPPMLVPDARHWLFENVESGQISDATVDLAFLDRLVGQGADASSATTLKFSFADVAFRSFRDGPMIRKAKGSAVLDGGQLLVTMETGVVDLGAAGELPIGPGTFRISDISAKPAIGEISFEASGGAAAAVALWHRLPVGRESGFDVTPQDVSGEVTANVTVTLPLKPRIGPNEINYDARIGVSGLALAKPISDRQVTGGDIEITVADGTAKIVGAALFDGVRASIDIAQSLAPGSVPVSSIGLVLGAQDRKRLGLDLGDVLVGPVKVTLSGDGAGPEARQQVEVDLSPARLTLAPLGIVKAKGKPGTLRFNLHRSEGRIAVDDLALETEGARVAGSLVLDDSGKLLSAKLPRVVARAGDSLSITADRDDSGTLLVTARGSRFDARRIVRNFLKGGGSDMATGAVRLDATVDTLTGFSDEALTGVNIAAAAEGGRVNALAITAQTAGSGSASMTLTPSGSVRRLEAEAGEVGRILRFLGLYGRVQGGRAVISGTVDASGGIRASIDGSRLTIVNEPALARLATAAESGPSRGHRHGRHRAPAVRPPLRGRPPDDRRRCRARFDGRAVATGRRRLHARPRPLVRDLSAGERARQPARQDPDHRPDPVRRGPRRPARRHLPPDRTDRQPRAERQSAVRHRARHLPPPVRAAVNRQHEAGSARASCGRGQLHHPIA